MKPLYQNIPENNEEIQKSGCWYVDNLMFYQDITQHQLKDRIMNEVYDIAVITPVYGRDKMIMDKNCFVNDISGIFQIISGLEGIDVFGKQVNSYDSYNYLGGVFKRTTSNGVNVEHFVELFPDTHKIKNDPWKGGSKTARIGKLVGFRYIKVRLL